MTVSPMVRIRNATGKFLELQCRRPKQEGSGAIVLLEDGDTIDDCMGSFDALKLEGELRKALTSFNVGKLERIISLWLQYLWLKILDHIALS